MARHGTTNTSCFGTRRVRCRPPPDEYFWERVLDYKLDINGTAQTFDVPADTPLLWVVRDEAHLTGTKFGCGIGLCGACTVHIEGQAARSCITPISAVVGRSITTIEGVAASSLGRAIQEAWCDIDVPQCGYCQSGQIMAATALLSVNPHPNDEQIDNAMSGNICRCGTYPRIRAAIKRVAAGRGP